MNLLIYKIILILVVAGLSNNLCFSQTYLGGDVYDGNGGPLSQSGNPYIVKSGLGLNVPTGKTLTIGPGVEIHCQWAAGWDISGTLNAQGTSVQPITIAKDTGVSNWGMVIVRSSSNITMQYCNLTGETNTNFPMIILQSPSSATFDNCTFSKSGGGGLGGTIGGVVSTNLSITNCKVENNNGNGIDIQIQNGGSPVTTNISNNVILNDSGSAYKLSPGIYPRNSTFSGNQFDGIELYYGDAAYSGSYENDVMLINSFNIISGVTVTFLPGISIKFKYLNSIDIYGTLVAEGTQSQTINFVRYDNDNFWGWLLFRQGSTGKFKYCNIDGGGPNGGFPMLNIQSPKELTFDNCNISNSRASALSGYIGNSPGNLSITNCTFQNNQGNGIYLIHRDSAENLIIDKNIFLSNWNSAMLLSGDIYPSNNSFNGNGFDGIEIDINNPTAKSSGTYDNNLLLKTSFVIDTGATITLKPGVEVKENSDNCEMFVEGGLIAEGTSDKYIKFYPYQSNGSMTGIIFEPKSSGSLKYCDFFKGGSGQYIYSAIDIYSPKNLTIEQCIIRESFSSGLYLVMGADYPNNVGIRKNSIFNNIGNGITFQNSVQGTITLECNTIFGNGGDGLNCTGGKIDFSHNYIHNNSKNGLKNTGYDTIFAKNNWWGDSTGPSGIGPGKGDSIAEINPGTIDYMPWAIVPSFNQCNDSAYSTEPPVIISLNYDTLSNGFIYTFVIQGKNFYPNAQVYLTRGNRPGPNPGDVQGQVKFVSYSTIIAEFDLVDFNGMNSWDLVVQNPDSSKATKTIYIRPALIWADFDWDGFRKYPTVPVGDERGESSLTVYNMGDDDGFVLLAVYPPEPDYIRLIIGNKSDSIWSSMTAVDKSVAYLILPINSKQEISIPLFWGISPENVVFPPHIVNPKGNNQIQGGGSPPAMGEESPLTVKGVEGATKSQVKGMLRNVLINSTCNYLKDLIKNAYGQGGDPNLLDNVLDAVTSELKGATDPSKMLETIAKKLVGFPAWASVSIAIGKCLVSLVGEFVNSWHAYVHQKSDAIRDDDEAKAALENRRASEWRGRLTAYVILIEAETQKPKCTPGPTNSQSWNGTVSSAYDPNDKEARGSFVTGFEPVADTFNAVYRILQKDLVQPIQYLIHFENSASASDAAVNVTILDTLDKNLDFTTLAIDTVLTQSRNGEFSWSLTDSILEIKFINIFLKPNQNPPEGEWQAVYSIKPKSNLTLGSRISNKAAIVFDYNPPISTPTVTHIVGAPSLVASKTNMDFGKHDLNSQTIDSVWLKNIGDYPLSIGNIVSPALPYKIISEQCSNSTLAPNDSYRLVISFTPTISTTFIDSIRILSNDLNNYPYKIFLKGSDLLTNVKTIKAIPITYKIGQIFPNPFSISTTINFDVPLPSRVRIKIYNYCGDVVRMLYDNTESPGSQSVEWDARNSTGDIVPEGIYFLQMEVNPVSNPEQIFDFTKTLFKY